MPSSELAALISARYNRREHGKLVQIYQHDPLIVSLVYSGHIEWLMGRPGRARECCEAARQLANEIGHPFMLAFASILGVSDHWYEGDLAANLASVERGMKVADEYAIQCTGSSVRCGRSLRWRNVALRRTCSNNYAACSASYPPGAFSFRSIEFCSPRNLDGSADRKSSKLRCFGRSPDEANRRNAGPLPRFIGSTARCCVVSHCETTGRPCACSNARLPPPGSSGRSVGTCGRRSASHA
jgi:hypothetical protein